MCGLLRSNAAKGGENTRHSRVPLRPVSAPVAMGIMLRKSQTSLGSPNMPIFQMRRDWIG